MFLRLFTALTLMMLALPMQAQADSKATVYNESNAPVMNSFGNCVRTKWMSESDPCAPPKPEPIPEPVVEVIPEPAPEPEPVEMVSQEERTVYFAFDSSVVSEEELKKLATLAKAVNGSKSVNNVRVVGYTDTIGASAYNEKLSNKRAQAVVDLLNPMIALDVQKDDLQVRGAGEATGADCKLLKTLAERKECHQKQRRVEVQLDRTFMELR